MKQLYDYPDTPDDANRVHINGAVDEQTEDGESQRDSTSQKRSVFKL